MSDIDDTGADESRSVTQSEIDAAMVFLLSEEAAKMKCGEARDEVRRRFGAAVESDLQKRFSGKW